MASNDELFARAQRVIPGGVNGPVRAFQAVGGTPYFVARAEGAHVWDTEGRRYVDLVQSYGAIIAGRTPAIVEAVQRAAVDGTSYGAPTEARSRWPRRSPPGCRRARWCGSCRAAPRRPCRPSAWPAGSPAGPGGEVRGQLPRPRRPAAGRGGQRPGCAGPAGLGRGDRAAVQDTVVVPYNRVPTLDERTACVIVEPIAANMGLVPPPRASSAACGPSARAGRRC